MAQGEGRLSQKRRKERTLAEILIKKFKMDHLSEGPSAGDRNMFEFLETPDMDRPTILFHGPKAQYLRTKAAQYLRNLDTTKKDPRKMALEVRLVEVAAVSKEVYAAYLEAQERKRQKKASPGKHLLSSAPRQEKAPVVPPVIRYVSAEEALRSDERLRRSLELVQKFHEAEMLLGLRRREPLVLLADQRSVAVEYFYVNDAEALHAAVRASELLGHEPEPSDGNGEVERSVVRYELHNFVSPETWEPKQQRKIEGVTQFESASFIPQHLLGVRCESHESRSREYCVFKFIDSNSTIEVSAKELQRYGLATIIHESRKLNLYVAMTEAAEKAFRRRGTKPSDVLSSLSGEGVYYKEDGVKLVQAILKDCLNWRVADDYYNNAYVPHEGGKLEYISIIARGVDRREKLKAKYQQIVAALPVGLSASFHGPKVKNGKSFFVYFQDREKIRERIHAQRLRTRAERNEARQNEEQGEAGVSPSQNGHAVADPALQIEESLTNVSRNRRLMELMVEEPNDSERETLISILGVPEKNGEEEINEFKERVKERLAGHALVRRDNPHIAEIFIKYHPEQFPDPLEAISDLLSRVL